MLHEIIIVMWPFSTYSSNSLGQYSFLHKQYSLFAKLLHVQIAVDTQHYLIDHFFMIDDHFGLVNYLICRSHVNNNLFKRELL